MRSVQVLRAGFTALVLAGAGALPVAAQSEAESGQVIADWNMATLAATSEMAPAVGNLYLAMVHGAMYDAVVSIAGGYQPYLGALEADPSASKTAAAAAAAHGVLVASFPDQQADLDAALEASLAAVDDGPAEDAGVAVGEAAAAAMLAAREGDGRGADYPLTFGDGPGEYRPTPPDFGEFPVAWIAGVKPFVAASVDEYRTAGPDPLDSAEYAADFNEVKAVGAKEGSTRTPEQDALVTFLIGPVPRWSAVERALAAQKDLDIVETARLFAIAGLASGDVASACHNDKYHWMFWRPITAIIEAESDGNDATEADPDWVPLAETTPPYPDHPSGWNCYAGAHAGALEAYFGTDEVPFEVTNADLGETRTYASFSEMLQNDIDVRVYLGIHFRNADEQAAEMGRKAASLAAERLAPID